MNPNAKLEVGSDSEVARILMGDHPAFATGREAPLYGCVYDEGALWRPDDAGIWREITQAEVTRLVMSCDGLPKPNSNGSESPFKVNAGVAASVRSLVQAACAVPGFFSDVKIGIAFRNQFLQVNKDGSTWLEPLTEKHRRRFALDFEYDPNAPLPEHFVRFLHSVWGDDTEQINMLAEWIGYLASERTDLQKIFMMVGPTRSGKGTILRLLESIFGAQATSFKAARIGSDRWMLGGFIGKTVAYDPDVRRASINDSESASVEAMLSISGEDAVLCERKWEQPVKVRLGTRLMLCTNPPFAMRDTGGVLSQRLLISTMTKSFLGKEDTELDAKLASEIPGIVRMAVLALQVLSKRGRFVEPASSAERRKQVEESEKPVRAFVDECCDLSNPAAETLCGILYEEFKKWCVENGIRASSNAGLRADLEAMGVRGEQPRRDGSRMRVYRGIALKPSTSRAKPPAPSHLQLVN